MNVTSLADRLNRDCAVPLARRLAQRVARARKVRRANAALHKHVYSEHYHVYLHLHSRFCAALAGRAQTSAGMGVPAPAARAVDPRWFKQAQRGLYAGKERLSGNHVSASKRQ